MVTKKIEFDKKWKGRLFLGDGPSVEPLKCSFRWC
jgi:hypothetical protein